MPDTINIRRFKQAFRFLGDHRERFQISTFRDLDPAPIPPLRATAPMQRSFWHTANRFRRAVSRGIPAIRVDTANHDSTARRVDGHYGCLATRWRKGLRELESSTR